MAANTSTGVSACTFALGSGALAIAVSIEAHGRVLSSLRSPVRCPRSGQGFFVPLPPGKNCAARRGGRLIRLRSASYLTKRQAATALYARLFEPEREVTRPIGADLAKSIGRTIIGWPRSLFF